MLARGVQLRLGKRWDERQRVDLAVRMVERDPDLFALVLEDVHVGDLGPGTELTVPVGPHVDQKAHAVDGEPGQRELVLRRVDDDLAAGRRRPDGPALATVRTESWEAVLEHHDLERVEGNLGCSAASTGSQRPESGGERGAIAPVRP